METKTLPSGSKLELGVAPFNVCKRLYKAIANELKLVDIEISSFDLKTIAGQDINAFKNVVMQLVGSDALEASFWECAERSLLNGQKIVPVVFEDEKSRADYLPVLWEVVRFNLSPFFKGLDLSSLIGGKPRSSAQP